VRKKRTARFEVPDSSPVGRGTVLTGKSDIPQYNYIAYILGSSIGSKFACFSKRKYLFQELIVIVQDPLCTKIKMGFKS
jgi:hypothetical protein